MTAVLLRCSLSCEKLFWEQPIVLCIHVAASPYSHYDFLFAHINPEFVPVFFTSLVQDEGDQRKAGADPNVNAGATQKYKRELLAMRRGQTRVFLLCYYLYQSVVSVLFLMDD